MHLEMRLRRAAPADADPLREMHRTSFAALSRGYYTPAAIEGLLAEHDTVDEAMIGDRTLLVAEIGGRLAASAGWTMRGPAYRGHREAEARERATIRSVFTHPDFARRGLAATLVGLCEEEAVMHGLASRIELCATLSGLPLYRKLGYQTEETQQLELANGTVFPVVRMAKLVSISLPESAAA